MKRVLFCTIALAQIVGIPLQSFGSNAVEAIQPLLVRPVRPPETVAEVLEYSAKNVVRNCANIAPLLRNDAIADQGEMRSAKTVFETWCDSSPSRRLGEDLRAAPSEVLLQAIHNWSLSMVLGNPNGQFYLPLIQNWLIENYSASWANAPMRVSGRTVSPVNMVTHVLVQFDSIYPVINSPKLTTGEKRKLLDQKRDIEVEFEKDRPPAGQWAR
jgi:hypothetical protein